MACKNIGLTPFILIPEADKLIIEEFVNRGITFLIYPNLAYASIEELYWIKGFSFIIVNTFQMLSCVVELGKKYSVIWWLHEPVILYEKNRDLFHKYNIETLNKVGIYSVTQKAKQNFENVFPILNSKLLLLGIPDNNNAFLENIKVNKKLIFAVIGGIEKRKGQDILLDALDLEVLSSTLEVEYWMIGNIPSDKFAKSVVKRVENNNKIKIFGNKTRQEIENLYQEIDVVIVCSREETLSIAAIEAMLYKKVCIVSDACGIVDYLTGKLKTLVYHWNSVEELANKINEKIDELALKGEQICKKKENANENVIKNVIVFRSIDIRFGYSIC